MKSNLLMLNVGHAEHEADWNFKDIVSPFTRIYYVTEGIAYVSIGDITHTLTPGNMYIIPAFTRHSDACLGRFCHYYVHIYEDVASTAESVIDKYDFPFELQGCELDRILFKALCEHNRTMALKAPDPSIYDNKTSLIECVRLNRARPLWDRLESMGIIYQLLGRFVKEATQKYDASDPRIRESIAMIGAMSETLTVNDLARRVGMTSDHFIRLFKKEVGCTPAQFAIDRKMTKAMLMLASEPIMIKEVAYTLGYDNLSYFTRLFRRHTGMTPNAYRAMHNRF